MAYTNSGKSEPINAKWRKQCHPNHGRPTRQEIGRAINQELSSAEYWAALLTFADAYCGFSLNG